MNNLNNGRINLQGPDISKLFEIYEQIPSKEQVSLRNPISTVWEDSILSEAFFSIANTKIIQNAIRANVFRKTNKIISPVDDDILTMTMKTIFIGNAKNLPNNITNQIKNINNIVINFSVDRVLLNLKGHLHYLNDISTLPKPNDRPMLTDSKHIELDPFQGFFD